MKMKFESRVSHEGDEALGLVDPRTCSRTFVCRIPDMGV
jgi:hypothetical protein